jgi:predicted PurR-regulated permease PerM
MNASGFSEAPPPLPTPRRDRAAAIIAAVAILAVLYFARDVLVPITLAVILSLLLAPFVRWLRRVGLGHTSSVLTAVLLLMGALGAVASVIGAQLVGMAESLPRYEQRVESKLRALESRTLGRVTAFTEEAAPQTEPRNSSSDVASAAPPPMSVELRNPRPSPWHVVQTIAAAVWVPIETAGIVLVVLIFVLLEHEGLRDRLIRIAGSADLRATTNAMNDAGVRLSRYFISQFCVNFGVGALAGVGLHFIHLPHALLWAALTLVLRFVPYVGVWIAALFATLLATAVGAGWSLAIQTVAVYVLVELIAAQLVEPQLYGHTTGLSPLTVVIAAIFWSWLWGPIGLIVSTPMTLCLLVAGRHTKALSLLEVMLGDMPALTLPQRFYQRALSADSDEIIASARQFLKRNSFAAYCDSVLVPALQLAGLDLESGMISKEQQITVRQAILNLIGALGEAPLRPSRRRDRTSVLDDTNVGRMLRRQREQRDGRWQGPLEVPRGSIVLCVGLGVNADELATELLVRVLRAQQVDARHISIEDLANPAPPRLSPASVSMVYLVSTRHGQAVPGFRGAIAQLRDRCPEALFVSLIFPGVVSDPLLPNDSVLDGTGLSDRTSSSFGEALQVYVDRQAQLESRVARVGSGAREE